MLFKDGVYTLPPNFYEWVREYEPVEKIGYSIFIYDIPHQNAIHSKTF